MRGSIYSYDYGQAQTEYTPPSAGSPETYFTILLQTYFEACGKDCRKGNFGIATSLVDGTAEASGGVTAQQQRGVGDESVRDGAPLSLHATIDATIEVHATKCYDRGACYDRCYDRGACCDMLR